MPRAHAGPESGQPFTRAAVNAHAFWRRVRKTEACWLWTGPTDRSGYGTMAVRKVRKGPIHAHRVSYVIAHGAIPAGACVMHVCDNRSCVNPAHLRLGTHRENMLDAAAKGRHHWQRPRTCKCGRRLNPYEHCRECNLRQRREYQRKHYAPVRAAHATDFAEYVRNRLAPLLPQTFAELCARTDLRRAEVVARFFGLYGYTPETGSQIAARLGITRERTRQLRNHVLRNLAVPADVVHGIPSTQAFRMCVARGEITALAS